jgi:FkbM family methyltransferase
VIRLLDWLKRYLECTQALGAWSAFVLFVVSRFSDSKQSIRLPDGRHFFFRGRLDLGVMSHFYKPGYRILELPTERVRTILDAGANIGDETVRFLWHHPEAEIVAIEASFGNASLLRLNTTGDDRVRILDGAFWPTDAHLELVDGQGMESFSVREVPEPTPDSLQAWSPIKVMEKFNWRSIDILKLDIEGAEYELFSRCADSWIDRVKVIIVEVNDHERALTLQAIFRALSGCDWNCTISGENLVFIRSDVGWKCSKSVGLPIA